jgi:hypothetical protein
MIVRLLFQTQTLDMDLPEMMREGEQNSESANLT